MSRNSNKSSVQKARCNKILALIPAENAASDISESSGEEKELRQADHDYYSSSPPPSLDSSLERMNLLDSDSSQDDVRPSPEAEADPIISHVSQNQPTVTLSSSVQDLQDSPSSPTILDIPLSPVIQAVFPSINETNYFSIPSISSIPMLNSPATQPISHNTPPTTSRQIRTRSRKCVQSVNPRLVVKKAKRMVIDFKWKKTIFRHCAKVEPVPFSQPPAEEMTPRDYFALFFSNEVLNHIVDQSNLYAIQKTGHSISLTRKDIEGFIAIHIVMGVVIMPSYLDYWNTLLRYAPVADVMPVKKYQQIRRFIHFADSTEESTDRFQKIRPVVEEIRQNCLRAADEENQFSIDEMTIPYKGTKSGNRRQYNAKKPKKWGFKAFVRSGVSGYVYDLILYGGEDTFRNIIFTPEEEALGFGAKVVLALCQSIRNKPCFVYFDNYYTSLELVAYLRNKLGIFSLGTVKSNRLRGCQNILASDKVLKKKGRGSYSQIVDNTNKVAVVKWHDNKPVTLACSFSDANPVSKIKRYSREHKARVDVDCPQVVKHYNTHMGGVDLSDMLIALYRTQMKTRRWYMGIFAQMIDICINNSWLLYRRHCRQKNVKKTMSLKEFRLQIFLAMTPRRTTPTTEVPGPTPAQKIKKPTVARPNQDVRCDGLNHLPFFQGRGRCRLCKTGQATIGCVKCNVRLCLTQNRNCFYDFHTKK